jgi:poly(A) RNA polymerase GLD2
MKSSYCFTSAQDHVSSAGTMFGLANPLEISEMDVLSEAIFHFHHTVEQPQHLLNRKLHLRDMIYYTISPVFPMCGLYIVGSSLNGFGNSKSDMDLCLMITNKDVSHPLRVLTNLSLCLVGSTH